ncbi:MAG: capsular polysaccharide biosynthesis protein [Parasphingorhabdus sp.]|jgi:capsular polysaccharide biosynthesis protein
MLVKQFPRFSHVNFASLPLGAAYSECSNGLRSIEDVYLYTDRLFGLANHSLLCARGSRYNIDRQGSKFCWSEYHLPKAFAIPGLRQNNWYHLLVELLFCSWLLNKLDLTIPVLLCSSNDDGVLEELCALFQQKGYNLLTTRPTRHSRLHLDSLYLFENSSFRWYCDGSINGSIISKFNEYAKFLRNELIEENTANPWRIVFSTRTTNDQRSEANQSEINEFFRAKGFEIVDFSKMSFHEQWRISRECRIMVGQHGANLVNSIFMNPGCQLVEISNMSIPHAVGLYTQLTKLIGLQCQSIVVDGFSRESLKAIEKSINPIVKD